MIKSLILVFAIGLLPTSAPTRVYKGIGTVFYHKEKWNDGKFACGGKAWTYANRNLPVCAHRTLPCGTWVLIEYRRRYTKERTSAWCKIMDRGPYMKRDKYGKQFNAVADRKAARRDGRKRRVGKWTGILDMGPGVQRKLSFSGKGWITVKWWKNNPLHKQLNETVYKP